MTTTTAATESRQSLPQRSSQTLYQLVRTESHAACRFRPGLPPT